MGLFNCSSKPKVREPSRRAQPKPEPVVLPSLDEMDGPASPEAKTATPAPAQFTRPPDRPPKRTSPIFDPAPARAPAPAPKPVPTVPTQTQSAADSNWDSSDDDETELLRPAPVAVAATAVAQPGAAQPVVARPGVAAVAVAQVVHDDSNWDDSDSDDGAVMPTASVTAKSRGRAPGAGLSPDSRFAPTIGCMEPKAIGGASYSGKLRKLKCSTCQTDVHRFTRAKWSDGSDARAEAVDYLFFRYYSGHSLNVERLRERLLPDQTKAAYACQCSWQSVAGLKELSEWGTPPGPEGGTGGGSASLRWVQCE